MCACAIYQQRVHLFPILSVPQLLGNVVSLDDISRVHYVVSSQVRALLLSSLALSTTAFDNADKEKEAVLMKSLTADIANAHEDSGTVLTGSFAIACFITADCTGAAKSADAVATDEAGTPQPFQPTRAPMFTLPTSEYTIAGCRWPGGSELCLVHEGSIGTALYSYDSI